MVFREAQWPLLAICGHSSHGVQSEQQRVGHYQALPCQGHPVNSVPLRGLKSTAYKHLNASRATLGIAWGYYLGFKGEPEPARARHVP